jgi:hypothetical protein
VADATPDDGLTAAERAAGQAPKGRPTPSRKEAEAARKARLGALPTDPKARRKVERSLQRDSAARERAAVRSGDARNFPARDRGPARAFVRDYVDGRLRLLEFLMPLVVLSWLTILLHNTKLYIYASFVMEGVVIVGIALSVMLNLRVKKLVREKFGADETRGVGFYAFSRALMPRPMRQPKPVLTSKGQPK